MVAAPDVVYLAVFGLIGTLQAADPVDLGAPRKGARRALIVPTPGLAESAYLPLAEALETRGLDAWLLRIELRDDPRAVAEERLPALSADPAWADTPWVAHGLGGRLAAWAARDGAEPSALAMLAVPLEVQPVALTHWMADRPLPAHTVDLAPLAQTMWGEQPALPLLLGEPLPALDRVSSAWLAQLRDWHARPAPLDLTEVKIPMWAGVGNLDNLAPPESVRPWLGAGRFVRFGSHRLDPREFDHAALLREARPLTVLARWVEAHATPAGATE